MQKLPVIGGRPEFISSVPSLCHVAYPSSNTVPTGNKTFTFQRPTIAALPRRSWNGVRKSAETGGDLNCVPVCPGLCCGWTGAVGCPREYPHPVFVPNLVTLAPCS